MKRGHPHASFRASSPLRRLTPDALRPAMQTGLTGVIGLTPLLLSPPAFRGPANASRIRSALDVLAPLKHFFSKPQGATDLARSKFDDQDTETVRLSLHLALLRLPRSHADGPRWHSAEPLEQSLAVPAQTHSCADHSNDTFTFSTSFASTRITFVCDLPSSAFVNVQRYSPAAICLSPNGVSPNLYGGHSTVA